MFDLRVYFSCLIFLICGLTVFAFSAAQQKEQPQPQPEAGQKTPTFSVEASMVVVDVTVRDRKGDLVENLKKEDFEVYEDNVKQDKAN